MKNLSWFNKIMFFLNIVFTVLTFIAYVLPFLAPKSFPLLSVLTLVYAFVFYIERFVFYLLGNSIQKTNDFVWFGLLIGITFINKFYKFSSKNFLKKKKILL